MRRAMLIVAALVFAVSGCRTTTVNPLYHELSYLQTPAQDAEKTVGKSLAVVPFADKRAADNKASTTWRLLNLLPLVIYTTGYETHPEVVYNTTACGLGGQVKAAGTLADAMPKLLADYLNRSRRFTKVQFVEAAEVRDKHSYDLVLRGTLVESKLKKTVLTYCLGPGAVALYILGAPVVRDRISCSSPSDG